MTIRAYHPCDSRTLWEIFYSAIHQTAAADYTPDQLNAWAPAQPDFEQWALRMEKRKPFLAEMDGKIVGYADLQADGCIDHFFVAGSMVRRGVGSALMRHILQHAGVRGLGRVYSHVSITARPFFERFGFEVHTAQQVCIRGVILNNFLMQMLLQ
jgi:putative acetyltransferase